MIDTDFNREAFLAWLDKQDGHIKQRTIVEQWPSFPMKAMAYRTGPFVDGEYAFYQHDLRRVAQGCPNRD